MTKFLVISAVAVLLSCQSKTVSTFEPTPVPSTLPAASINTENTIERFAFGCCSYQKYAQPIWQSILEKHPDIYIGVGDNIHASQAQDRPFSEAYRLWLQNPDFANFRALVPMIATWNDHDYGVVDGGSENSSMAEAKRAYLDFFATDREQIRKADPSSEGIYHSFVFGTKGRRLQVILLDTRSFKSSWSKDKNGLIVSENSAKTILGEAQWRWLRRQLQVPAEVKVLVSSFQVIPEDNRSEKWANFPAERERLFEMIRATGAKNLVIISGDRGFGEVNKLKRSSEDGIIEITAGSLNKPNSGAHEKNKHRIGPSFSKENFGFGEIDWNKKRMHLYLFGIDGESFTSIEQKIRN